MQHILSKLYKNNIPFPSMQKSDAEAEIAVIEQQLAGLRGRLSNTNKTRQPIN